MDGQVSEKSQHDANRSYITATGTVTRGVAKGATDDVTPDFAAALSNPVPLFIFEVIYVMLRQLQTSALGGHPHTREEDPVQESMFRSALIDSCVNAVRTIPHQCTAA